MKARLYFAAVLFLCARVCANASHRSHCFLGLTQIPQISLNCTPDVKSHRCSTVSLESLFNPIFTPILSI